jgi:hypothetical protein
MLSRFGFVYRWTMKNPCNSGFPSIWVKTRIPWSDQRSKKRWIEGYRAVGYCPRRSLRPTRISMLQRMAVVQKIMGVDFRGGRSQTSGEAVAYCPRRSLRPLTVFGRFPMFLHEFIWLVTGFLTFIHPWEVLERKRNEEIEWHKYSSSQIKQSITEKVDLQHQSWWLVAKSSMITTG